MHLKSIIKIGFVWFAILFSSLQINAQAGISFTAGLGTAKNHLEAASPGSSIGLGYVGAAEARFLGQDMYFVTQIAYGKYKLLPFEGIEMYKDDNNFQVLHGRIGMGFTIFRFGKKSIVRTKILGSLDKTLQYTSAALKGTNFNGETLNSNDDTVNDATVGMLLGFGLDIGMLVIDFEYERGLINAFYKVPGSNFDYMSLRVGILIN